MLSPRFHRTETTPYKYHELHDGDHERYAFDISSSDKTVNQATPMKGDGAEAPGTDDLVGVRVRKHFVGYGMYDGVVREVLANGKCWVMWTDDRETKISKEEAHRKRVDVQRG